LRVEGKDIRVELKTITSVLPHEETVPELSSALAGQIEEDRFQRDPIIIEREHQVVLDGMHRLKALKDLGARLILCHSVDYSSPDVRLDCWARLLEGEDLRVLTESLRSLGIDSEVTREEALSLVEQRRTRLGVLTGKRSFVSSTPFNSLTESFNVLRSIDASSSALGLRQDFIERERIDEALSRPRSAVVIAPRATKREVLSAARSGRLFPHKSTLHSVSLRIVGVNYPLSELRRGRPPRDLLEERLGRAEVSILEPPVTYLGRRYRERLLVVGRQ